MKSLDKKIRAVATGFMIVFFVVTTTLFAIFFVRGIQNSKGKDIIIGLVIALVGYFMCWASYILIAGYAKIVENSDKNAKDAKETTREIIDRLDDIKQEIKTKK